MQINSSDNKEWSDELIAQTRDILDLGFVPRDNFIYMKNSNHKFGKIGLNDWLERKYLIKDSRTDEEYFYEIVDDLINAGWVVD